MTLLVRLVLTRSCGASSPEKDINDETVVDRRATNGNVHGKVYEREVFNKKKREHRGTSGTQKACPPIAREKALYIHPPTPESTKLGSGCGCGMGRKHWNTKDTPTRGKFQKLVIGGAIGSERCFAVRST